MGTDSNQPVADALAGRGPIEDEPDAPFGPHVVRVLDADGRVRDDAAPIDLDDDALLSRYEWLVLARRLDERLLSLQRQGRIATYAPMAGQEAAQVGSAVAMAESDWLYPTYRDHAAKVVRGISLRSLLRGLKGRPGGGVDADARVFPEYIPIASQLPHAVGAGMATRYRDEDDVHLVHFGDGATSEGDFHEALNVAGVFEAPTVFFCNNNQWAISVPRSRQTAAPTLAAKADAYGFPGVRVDGTDPLAVERVTREALARARRGEGPTLIEAVMYRHGAHTTADDPDVYRDGMPESWERYDPVPRFERFLRRTNRLDAETAAAVEDRVDERIAEAIRSVEAETTEDPRALFAAVFAGDVEDDPHLTRQRDRLESLVAERGADAFREN